jgi:hypothetical protein
MGRMNFERICSSINKPEQLQEVLDSVGIELDDEVQEAIEAALESPAPVHSLALELCNQHSSCEGCPFRFYHCEDGYDAWLRSTEENPEYAIDDDGEGGELPWAM